MRPTGDPRSFRTQRRLLGPPPSHRETGGAVRARARLPPRNYGRPLALAQEPDRWEAVLRRLVSDAQRPHGPEYVIVGPESEDRLTRRSNGEAGPIES